MAKKSEQKKKDTCNTSKMDALLAEFDEVNDTIRAGNALKGKRAAIRAQIVKLRKAERAE